MILMPSCKEVGGNLTEYMEGKLPVHKRMGIRLHLMMCKMCDGLRKALLALPKVAKEILSPPAEAPAEAKATLDRVLKNLKGTKPS